MAISAASHRTRRRRIQPIGVLAAALLVVAGTYVAGLAGEGLVALPPAAPAAPVAPPVVVVPVAREPGAITGSSGQVDLVELDSRIATWSAMAAADAADYLSTTNLGILYLGRARLSGDLADYGRAAAATSRALVADPVYGPARALDATVRFATHDFRGALAAATALLADEPGHADALAVVGDASLELGQVGNARRAYASLASIAPGPALDVRLARLAYVTGDPARALTIARSARDEALGSGEADMAFYEYQLGEYARLNGKEAAAAAAFRASLDARPAHIGALVGLARVEAAAGRVDDAVAALERAMAIAPVPDVVALLGDMRAGSGEQAVAEQLYATVRLTADLGELAGSVYDRQLIAFELDHGGATDEVLAEARRSAADRPDAAGHDLVAWALHRLGRDVEAAAQIEAALATGIVDARIQFHAGAIAMATDDVATGEQQLRKALALGPALDPLERSEAETLLAEADGP
jgi:tetratricopeptide (TPR) repeat protein